MRQKKFGKKIQNWHKPLHPSQLRERFLEHRYDDPEIRKRGRSIDAITGVDDCWNPFDPYLACGCWYCVEAHTLPLDELYISEDLYRLEFDEFLTRTLNPSDPLFRPEWAADSGTAGPAPSSVEQGDVAWLSVGGVHRAGYAFLEELRDSSLQDHTRRR